MSEARKGYVVCKFCKARGDTLDFEPPARWIEASEREPKEPGGIAYEGYYVCPECTEKPEPFVLRCPLIDGDHEPRFVSQIVTDERGRFVAFDIGETKFYCKSCGREAIAWRPKKKRTIGNQIDLTKTFRAALAEETARRGS